MSAGARSYGRGRHRGRGQQHDAVGGEVCANHDRQGHRRPDDEQARARHRRTTFDPHPATTQSLIDAIWNESDARYRYLGSWHRHPDSMPRPSGTDVHTTEAVATEPHVGLSEPVVLIQSTRRGGGGGLQIADARAWRWSHEDRWLFPCELISVELEERYCPLVEVSRGWLRGPEVLAPRARG